MINSESHAELSQTLPLFQQCRQKEYSVFTPIAPCGGSSAVELVVPVCLCKPRSGDLLCLHVKWQAREWDYFDRRKACAYSTIDVVSRGREIANICGPWKQTRGSQEACPCRNERRWKNICAPKWMIHNLKYSMNRQTTSRSITFNTGRMKLLNRITGETTHPTDKWVFSMVCILYQWLINYLSSLNLFSPKDKICPRILEVSLSTRSLPAQPFWLRLCLACTIPLETFRYNT